MLKKAAILLASGWLAATASAGETKFTLADYFEFQAGGDWNEATFQETREKGLFYRQGTAESKDGGKALVFATMQVLDPEKVPNPALRKIDATAMANFMFQSMKFTGPDKDRVKPEKEIAALNDAGPAEKYFRFAEPGGKGMAFFSGISLKGKKGAYAILIVEKKKSRFSPRDQTFWRKVGKSLKTK